MDDLISRTELLHSLNEQAPKPTTDDLYTVNLCIINAPAVDAIPVEWLRKKRKVAIWQFAGAIDWLLSDWQKEQEARQ